MTADKKVLKSPLEKPENLSKTDKTKQMPQSNCLLTRNSDREIEPTKVQQNYLRMVQLCNLPLNVANLHSQKFRQSLEKFIQEITPIYTVYTIGLVLVCENILKI